MMVPVIARMGRRPAGKVRAEAAQRIGVKPTAGEKVVAKPHGDLHQWKIFTARPGS